MLLCVHWIFFFLVVTRKKKIQWTREIREKVHDYLQNSHISDVWQNYFAIIVAKKTCTLMILSRLNNAWQLNMTWYDISSDIAAMMQLPALESNRPILEWCWLRLSHAFLSLYNSRTPPRKHAQHRFIGASSTDWSLWCWCVSHFFTLSHLAYHNNLTLHRVFSFTSLVKKLYCDEVKRQRLQQWTVLCKSLWHYDMLVLGGWVVSNTANKIRMSFLLKRCRSITRIVC